MTGRFTPAHIPSSRSHPSTSSSASNQHPSHGGTSTQRLPLSPNTPCFTAGGIFMPNSQIRFSGPFSFVPNLPYRRYPERLSTARTVTI